MAITAKNIGRINVWPTYDAARAVDTEESEFVCRLTVYRTNAEARAHLTSVGGGGDYTAQAVHLDGSTTLRCASISCTDNGRFSFIGWVKHGGSGVNADDQVWVVDPEGDYNNFLQYLVTEQWDTGIRNAAGPSSFYALESDNGVGPVDQWQCLIYSMDANAVAGSRKGKLFIGDDDQTNVDVDIGDPITAVVNGVSFWVGGDGYGANFTGDVADFRIMPGVSLLDGGGNIPLVTRRLFIDENGKPVDPAIATAALGFSGPILLSGDANTFATNQGTGGSFTLTGSPTNATTSPSD